MSRRSVSPIRNGVRSEMDPRDAMIRKLKEDLIVARGREKELAILENYLVELIEKTKLLSAETVTDHLLRPRPMKKASSNWNSLSNPSTNSRKRSIHSELSCVIRRTNWGRSRKKRLSSSVHSTPNSSKLRS